MIPEGSCDTSAENSALHHMNKLHFKIYWKKTVILNCNHISQYFYNNSFYCIFWPNKWSNWCLLSVRDFFQKYKKKNNVLNGSVHQEGQ